MRRLAILVVVFAVPASAAPDLARARALDREGAKAYAEGRYEDAVRAFDEAYRAGGPTFELWNVAKCWLRLEQYERAGDMLERYLAQSNVPKADREEATRQLEALKKRPSTLTVTSTPAGLDVVVDGRSAGSSPVTTNVTHGAHEVRVGSITRTVEARFGAPVTVAAENPPAAEVPPNPFVTPADARLALRAAVGISLPRAGELGTDVGPAFLLGGTYRVLDVGKVALGAGALLSIAGDGWDNRTGAPNESPTCGPIPDAQGATAIAFYGHASATAPVADRVTVAGLGGVGIAGYAAGNLGGDVFVPTCDASPGVRPTLMLGARVDYALTRLVKLSAVPLTWQVQPSFDGTRAVPRDASGVWMRFGMGVGAGVDLDL